MMPCCYIVWNKKTGGYINKISGQEAIVCITWSVHVLYIVSELTVSEVLSRRKLMALFTSSLQSCRATMHSSWVFPETSINWEQQKKHKQIKYRLTQCDKEKCSHSVLSGYNFTVPYFKKEKVVPFSWTNKKKTLSFNNLPVWPCLQSQHRFCHRSFGLNESVLLWPGGKKHLS